MRGKASRSGTKRGSLNGPGERSRGERSNADRIRDPHELYKAIYGDRKEISADVFQARLEEAHTLFLRGGTTARDGVVAALGAAIDFIASNSGLPPFIMDRRLQPLNRLLRALQDLSDGAVQEVLQPQVRRRGGTKLTKSEAEFRLLCAVATRWLEPELGNGAAEYVAKRLRKHGFARSRRDRSNNTVAITPDTVKHWRRSAIQFKQRVLLETSLSFEAWFCQQWMAALGSPGVRELEIPRLSVDGLLAAQILDEILPVLFGHLRKKK